MNIKVLRGSDLRGILPVIAQFRLTYFKGFPYLYEGSQTYEDEYLRGFANHANSLVVVALDEHQKIIAISTGMPLTCDSEIIANVPRTGFDAERNYYLAETIIDFAHRGKGLTRKLTEIAEKEAVRMGFSSCSILTVIREPNHPLRPAAYVDSDEVWNRLGYQKTSTQIYFTWPTRNQAGEVLEGNHPMMFWIKDIL